MNLQIICPITQDTIVDPVSTPGGHSYSKAAITTWVGMRGRSPMTPQPVTLAQLKPNFALIEALEQMDKELK
jgi:hypothetical protein